MNISSKTIMDTYIVRVYRNNRKSGDEVSGLVEDVGADKMQAFQTMSGLLETLRQLPGMDETHHANSHEAIPGRHG
jgi:hypothetical protein